MKYTTITKENIHLIAFRIKQFIERMEIIGMQCQYPTAKKMLTAFGKQPFPNNFITKSVISYLMISDYRLEIERNMGKLPFIRINYQYNNCGMLLKVGDKICILPNHIHLKRPNVFLDEPNRAFGLDTWFKGNYNKAINQSLETKQYSDDYWNMCDKEYELEEFN